MTKAEIAMWSRLKTLRREGFHFRRQAPFRAFFLDFVCFRQRLVIEVDGGVHTEELQAEHDLIRDNILRREGFRVLRFWNGEVLGNLEGVMITIRSALHHDFPTLTAAPSVPPHEGEG